MSSNDIDHQDGATLDFYARLGEAYTAGAPAGPNRFLASFLDLLRPNSRILDLGCGSGRDSEAMIAAGHDVDPTDGTPEIAAAATKRLGMPVRVLRFGDLDKVASYDAVWASASLLHVPRSALPGVLRRVFDALKPGGLHFASYKAGDEEGRDSFGRYFNYLSAEVATLAYSSSAPWNVVSIPTITGAVATGARCLGLRSSPNAHPVHFPEVVTGGADEELRLPAPRTPSATSPRVRTRPSRAGWGERRHPRRVPARTRSSPSA